MRVVGMLVVVLGGVWLCASPTTSAAEGGERTLSGEWAMGLEDGGLLEAVFEETGSGLWEVSFHFDFQGRPHTFSGEAEGDLTSGALGGQVWDEREERTWVFSGEFEEGVFRGDHAEIEYGVRVPTGTLWLSE